MELTQGTILHGGTYKIVKTLGQGGFGITYLAEQVMLGRKVAVKEFFMKELCERDEATSHVTLATEGIRETVGKFREKFLKEARNIAKLSHPNIVRIIDVFEENDTAYYVMEYADKGSLADKVKQQGYLPEPVATRYIVQVADALNYIHQQKMNHLDVKPGNIMLTKDDNVILIDFGLSKQYDSVTGNQTSTTPVGISEGYAPLEQYRQGGVGEFSPETDIYALGATYFKLLTGTTPPSASDVNEEGVPVSELNAKGVSQVAIEVICKAMEGRKRDRMSSVIIFADCLKNSRVSAESVSNTNDEETRIISTAQDSISVPHNTSDISLSQADIRKKAMAQYLAEERAAAEKKAIEEEIRKIKEEERQKRLADEERIRKEEAEQQRLIAEERKREEDEKRRLQEDEKKRNTIVFEINKVKFKMIKVEGGTFNMKETVSCGFLGLSSKEIVQKTTLSDYWIGETQVTQALWEAVMGSNPSYFKGSNKPVECVSWNDCQKFITELNKVTCRQFCLPTEAQWEFAARGGNKSNHYKFSGSNDFDDVAWNSHNSKGITHDVATKRPNELGIYDMTGNVWEWCDDKYSNYKEHSVTNPHGYSGRNYVCRGGSYDHILPSYIKIRNNYAPHDNFDDLGFRLAVSE